ncbi:N-acetylmuramoyl-L-alanine amidase [Ruegeria litorea]|uniref:N-acetylmuramoyl-L-alanine amidase n=1 Tax=Falsiruegeria litorea TaxID=1280831 RepID=A0ABS5WWD3_9RHOB|nr:N-acetylmuramoyl-L-alanine amidase [Falsiruegeria litorea]MBT3143363.1 N-acetylmuramoyl-L-alanine amidase [Falsiruegeria litorea]
MNKINEELSKVIAQADTAVDQDSLTDAIERLDAMLKDGFVQAEASALPYAPALEMTTEFETTYAQAPEGGAEGKFGRFIGSMALDSANAIARAKRRAEYRLKTLFGFDGLRIVEDGDSWTQYPVLLEDIGDQLQAQDDFAVFSVGGAGDLVSDMANEKEYLSALQITDAAVLLVSGGGNDMFGHLQDILVDYTDGASPADLINHGAFGPILRTVTENYETILTDVATSFPDVCIFTHGYDLPFPLDDGKWIGPALTARSIPFDIGRGVLNVILDMFNAEMVKLEARHSNMVFCDLRGEVDRGLNSWFDELHPKNAGYARAAAAIERVIRDRMLGGLETTPGHLTAKANPERSKAAGTVVLDPGHGGTTKVGGSSANNATGPHGTLEKDLTLDVALRTKTVLEHRGYNVLLTRSSDVNLGLSARAAVARSVGAAVFVSIHFNGSTNHNAQGTETFVHKSLPNGAHPSKALCRAVQSEMVAALGLRDRNKGFPLGAKSGGFGVLNPHHHAQQTAAVLHEVSFLDRADEEERLSKVSYKRKIAIALADGIEAYLTGIAPAENFSAAEIELGDAMELAKVESDFSAAAEHLFEWRDTSDDTDECGFETHDVSNGHLLGVDSVAQGNLGFLHALAEIEARFSKGQGHVIDGPDEGHETSERDPAIERAFGSHSFDVGANVTVLADVFGRVESTSFSHSDFEAFIRSLGLRYFSPSEFLVLGGQNKSGKCAGKNTLPPQSLWGNIANTALLVDRIRDRLNAPVFITSAYRSPPYNACIGGASASQHMRFNALDWYCTAHDRAHWRQVAEQLQASDPGRFAGFIKDYAGGNFVHIDTRYT